MKKTFYILSILLLAFFWGNSQTNVSGGIFSDTTWTLANSPYIVTANIVVFPGVILTIEPGVAVKFDNGTSMEIRQSTLIANGTDFNHIVFTSNNLTPIKGIWSQIYLNNSVTTQIKHCEFYYADNALMGGADSLSVVSSTFTENIMGMDAASSNYIRVDSCIFRNNDTGQSLQSGDFISNCTYIKNGTGLYADGGISVINCVLDSNSVYGLLKHMACGDTIRDNEIKYNGTGIANDFSGCGGTEYIHHNAIENNNVGILFQNTGGSQIYNIYSNSLCSNSTYNIQNLTALSINAANNCWCSNDLSYIEITIYDAYDNVSYGIVTYIPIDTLICPMIYYTGFADHTLESFNIYPNPFSNSFSVKINDNEQSQIILYDIFSRKLLEQSFTNSTSINTEQLAKGIYLYEVRNKGIVIKQGKVVKD